MVAEGVRNSVAVASLAARRGVEMPITRQMVDVLHHGKDPAGASRRENVWTSCAGYASATVTWYRSFSPARTCVGGGLVNDGIAFTITLNTLLRTPWFPITPSDARTWNRAEPNWPAAAVKSRWWPSAAIVAWRKAGFSS